MRLASALALFALLAALPVSAEDGDQRYVLEARLDPDRHVVEGIEHIRWENAASVPASELYFHLYMNAFASNETVFMRESSGALRGIRKRGTGRIDVLELRAGNVDLLPRSHSNLILGDATQLRVDLATPVPPGATIELDVRFRTTLPPLFARAGYAGSFHMVAHWFPKLARREPDGRWATFPYHGRGEFYADFADYELTVVAPRGLVIGATGSRGETHEEGIRRRHRFVADRVHDVAFCAWDGFLEHEETASHVRVRFLYPPGYEAALERHAAVVRAGLEHYGQLFGPYPYEDLTVVVPPRLARGAHAMEYPRLFVTAGPWWTVPGVHIGTEQDVTAHELAHQWFQGLIATNEVEWPMLDEGLAEWAGLELLSQMHGARGSAVGLPGFSLSYFQALRGYVLGVGRPPLSPAMPAHAYASDEDYGRAVYAQTALALETVGRVWGRDKLTRALGRYAREQRFAHPRPEDLLRAFDDVYGEGFAERWIRPMLLDGEIDDAGLGSGAEESADEVAIMRNAGLALPLAIARKAHGVHIDPGYANLLDPTLRDNGWSREPPDWTTRFFSWLLPLGQFFVRLVVG